MGTLSETLAWIEHHVGLTIALAVAWVVVLIVSAWAVRWFLISIPSDYFTKPHVRFELWKNLHPVLRWTVLLLKNLVGLALALAGIVMLFTPGQGILSVLLGLSLLDIPGKRAVERKIVQRPAILHFINAMRAHAGKDPLTFAPRGELPA